MSTHVPGFQSSSGLFGSFCIGEIATTSIRVKGTIVVANTRFNGGGRIIGIGESNFLKNMNVSDARKSEQRECIWPLF